MPRAPSSIVADSWNRRIGTLWAKLFSAHALGRHGCVVEVGPGFADKVGLGLAGGGFGGTLYVVEPNQAACGWIAGRYRQLLPEADIVPLAEPIPSARLLTGNVDVLVMNHVLDDLVLNAALAPGDRERVFGRMRPDRPASPKVAQTWQRMFADPSALGALCAQVVADLRRLLARTTPRVFGASQYQSWYLTANGLGAVDRLAAGLLADLAVPIGATSASDRAILRRHGQDPDRWLVREVGSGGWETEPPRRVLVPSHRRALLRFRWQHRRCLLLAGAPAPAAEAGTDDARRLH